MESKAIKKKSTLLKDALALFLITLISGLSLSYIYEVTKAPIEEQKLLKKQKANQAVFLEAETFEEDEELESLAANTDLTSLNAKYKGITIDEINKAYNSNGELLGYDITVSTTQGYKDVITIVIGYSLDGTIEGMQMLALNETAGLGMRASDPDFISQFTGKQVEQFERTKTGATAENQIDALSGATITTDAVVNAVNAGISFVKTYAELGGGQNE
ncbi:FMN-binding protein [Variimorphobacter saccharofermentans]|uniref:FMN-binding protein n=1 Tax=Variimorphobacter saccharofermentans TaxID=2755051 RepID=UPI001E58A274|nr:FMN-binding protein [Variimorphobacter saccharofermentans]